MSESISSLKNITRLYNRTFAEFVANSALSEIERAQLSSIIEYIAEFNQKNDRYQYQIRPLIGDRYDVEITLIDDQEGAEYSEKFRFHEYEAAFFIREGLAEVATNYRSEILNMGFKPFDRISRYAKDCCSLLSERMSQKEIRHHKDIEIFDFSISDISFFFEKMDDFENSLEFGTNPTVFGNSDFHERMLERIEVSAPSGDMNISQEFDKKIPDLQRVLDFTDPEAQSQISFMQEYVRHVNQAQDRFRFSVNLLEGDERYVEITVLDTDENIDYSMSFGLCRYKTTFDVSKIDEYGQDQDPACDQPPHYEDIHHFLSFLGFTEVMKGDEVVGHEKNTCGFVSVEDIEGRRFQKPETIEYYDLSVNRVDYYIHIENISRKSVRLGEDIRISDRESLQYWMLDGLVKKIHRRNRDAEISSEILELSKEFGLEVEAPAADDLDHDDGSAPDIGAP